MLKLPILLYFTGLENKRCYFDIDIDITFVLIVLIKYPYVHVYIALVYVYIIYQIRQIFVEHENIWEFKPLVLNIRKG